MHPEALKIFSDELQKCAKEVVTSVAQLHPHLEKGDILLLSAERPKPKSPVEGALNAIYRAGAKAVMGTYVHSAAYVGGGKAVEIRRTGDGIARSLPIQDMIGDKSVVVVRPAVPPEQKEQAVSRLLSAVKNKARYDMPSFLDVAQHHFTGLKATDLRARSRQHKFVCSNLIAAAYKGTNLVPKKDPHYVIPSDFLRSPKLKPVATLVPGAK